MGINSLIGSILKEYIHATDENIFCLVICSFA